MKPKNKLISLLLAVTMVLALIPVLIIGSPVGQAAANDDFCITGVDVVNQRVAIVHLSNEIGTHFEQYALARPNYLCNFIKFNGTYLQTNKAIANGNGARIYIRDDKKSFELVLGNSTGTYSGATFAGGGTIQFDFENAKFIPFYHMHNEVINAQSGDVWVRDIYDKAMTQDVFTFTAPASLSAAPNLAIESARILDSRAIYVKFNQRIIYPEVATGMSTTESACLLSRAYAAGNSLNGAYNITPSGGTALQATYSYCIAKDHPESDGTGENREFIIYYNGDIVANTAYAISWGNAATKGLVNAASANAVTATLPALTTVPRSDYKLVKAELVKSESGKNEIVLEFDRPFAYTRIATASKFRTVNQPTFAMSWANKLYEVPSGNDVEANRVYYQALFETATNMCGTVLTVDDLKEMLTFNGVKAGGKNFLDAFPGEDIIASFRDSHTIVVYNGNRLDVTLDPGATVSVKADALVNYGTRPGGWGTSNNIGTIGTRTNGLKNTATYLTNVPITTQADVVQYANGYDPSWNKGVTATKSNVKFGHNDVYYFEYDGKKDPLVGGFSPNVRISSNSSGTTYAPNGRAFTGTLEQDYVVQSVYESVDLENKYVKATIVPGQAARFLYFIFKPTGHDAFYTNPAATNYNISGMNGGNYPANNNGAGTFVLGWLFVWGGTFPVFDGCEHGQIWTTPFAYEIKEYPDGAKSVICKLKNEQNTQINSGGYVPSSSNISVGGGFVPFGTGIEYTLEYKLAVDSPVVDMIITAENTAQVARTYEFYVCNTYAPGEVSEWGSGTMKYIDAAQLLQYQSSSYAFVQNVNNGEPSNGKTQAELKPYQNLGLSDLPQSVADRMFSGTGSGVDSTTGSVSRSQYYAWDTMRHSVNHGNSTQFANDLNRLPQADWSGSVNLSNLEGVVRAGTDLMKSTPGIKYWTWGYNQMFNNIPFEVQGGNSARPYLEPWPAAGNQYYQNRAINAGETHNWTESYYHTFGLDMATNATENAIAQLKFYADGGSYRPAAEFYATKLEKQLTAVLRRNDTNAVIKTYSYVSKIMAAEVIEADSLVPAGTKVTLELYEGATAAGVPFFTAWAEQGKAFEADRTSPVEEVIISHGKSIDIPGRASSSQYTLRQVFAYCEPFWVDGFMNAIWTVQSGSGVTITSGVGSNGISASTGNTWWHSFNHIQLVGGTPGSTAVLRATAKDANIPVAQRPYAEMTVNVKKPLYLKIPYNPGNTIGSTNTYARNQYSPYNFNLDMTVPVSITRNTSDTITGPLQIEVWDRRDEKAAPFISFVFDDVTVSGADVGTFNLNIPAYTLPREEYYKIVVRTASGDALGYEWFRVDGYSAIDWSKVVAVSGNNLTVTFDKKNSASGAITLASGATAYVNDTQCAVTVSNNVVTITGGNTAAVTGENTVSIVGIQFPQYPGYTMSDSLTYIK